jgi:hypothetical protein
MEVMRMNKLLVFPLALMYLISIFVFINISVNPSGSSTDFRDISGISIDNQNRNVSVDDAEPKTFNIWNASGIMFILLTAIALGVVAGIGFLGSGLSDTAQGMIFSSILFLGIWTCLTIVTSTLFFDNMITDVMYMGITMMFILGLGIHLSGGDE